MPIGNGGLKNIYELFSFCFLAYFCFKILNQLISIPYVFCFSLCNMYCCSRLALKAKLDSYIQHMTSFDLEFLYYIKQVFDPV